MEQIRLKTLDSWYLEQQAFEVFCKKLEERCGLFFEPPFDVSYDADEARAMLKKVKDLGPVARAALLPHRNGLTPHKEIAWANDLIYWGGDPKYLSFNEIREVLTPLAKAGDAARVKRMIEAFPPSLKEGLILFEQTVQAAILKNDLDTVAWEQDHIKADETAQVIFEHLKPKMTTWARDKKLNGKIRDLGFSIEEVFVAAQEQRLVKTHQAMLHTWPLLYKPSPKVPKLSLT